jgi:hypothetical protein
MVSLDTVYLGSNTNFISTVFIGGIQYVHQKPSIFKKPKRERIFFEFEKAGPALPADSRQTSERGQSATCDGCSVESKLYCHVEWFDWQVDSTQLLLGERRDHNNFMNNE